MTFKENLIRSGFIGQEATLMPLSGGVSSDIYLLQDKDRCAVIKRALEKLKVTEDWRANPDRNIYEKRYLEYVHRFLPEAVPRLVYAEEGSGFFAMEYLGEADGYLNLKEEFLQGYLHEQAVERVITALAKIHQKSWGNESVKKLFDTTTNFIELRVSPYFYFLKDKFPALAQTIDQNCQNLLSFRKCLVHGDFSPKNILINEKRSVLLDCEVAWYGNPVFDLAFFLNHLLLKTVHLQDSRFLALAKSVWRLYNKLTVYESEAHLVDLLPMLLLARVAGKSPVEYLSADDKEKIQQIAISLIEKKPESFLQILAKFEQI